jgi:hypothetical protein
MLPDGPGGWVSRPVREGQSQRTPSRLVMPNPHTVHG